MAQNNFKYSEKKLITKDMQDFYNEGYKTLPREIK
jgi:hypothetical protein